MNLIRATKRNAVLMKNNKNAEVIEIKLQKTLN